MLFGDDVIDFVNGIGKRLRHQAIFALRFGALPDPFAKDSIHPSGTRAGLEGTACFRLDQSQETTDSFKPFRFDSFLLRE
jgi:hypothetical protein